jgi:hypothetical protein
MKKTVTNELIDQLSSNLQPAPGRTSLFGIAMLVGGALAFGLLLFLLGVRSDLFHALAESAFWMKWGLALTTAAIAFALCLQLARPEGRPGWYPLALVMPIIALVAFACIQASRLPPADRHAMWLGDSALQCAWCIPVLAVPLLLTTLLALRRLAPTRPRLAGFSAGMLAGAVSAAIYALHCGESAPGFVAAWYSLGMLVPAVAGFIIGPRVLRW